MAGEELEAEIVRDPDDPAPRLVYADWLMGRGDPRGELISLQSRGLATEAEAWIERHAGALYGEFSENLRQREWRLGFLHSCTLVLAGNDAVRRLAAFLAHPSARVVRRLDIKTTDPRAAIEILTQHDLSPLHHLAIRALAPVELGAIGGLSHAAPDLRSLALRDTSADGFVLDGLHLPSLRALALDTPGDITDGLGPLCAVSWPVLARLALRSNAAPGPAWGPVFEATPFPALRDLTFDTYHAGFASFFTDSTLLHRLELLRYATPTPEIDLRIFVVRRSQFAHLRRLGLPRSHAVGDALRLQLRRLCPDVRFH